MDEYDRLRALAAQLALSDVKVTSLLGVATVDASDAIECLPRPEDGDRLWYFTSDGMPIIEGDDEHRDDAAIFVLGRPARRAEHTKEAAR